MGFVYFDESIRLFHGSFQYNFRVVRGDRFSASCSLYSKNCPCLCCIAPHFSAAVSALAPAAPDIHLGQRESKVSATADAALADAGLERQDRRMQEDHRRAEAQGKLVQDEEKMSETKQEPGFVGGTVSRIRILRVANIIDTLWSIDIRAAVVIHMMVTP